MFRDRHYILPGHLKSSVVEYTGTDITFCLSILNHQMWNVQGQTLHFVSPSIHLMKLMYSLSIIPLILTEQLLRTFEVLVILLSDLVLSDEPALTEEFDLVCSWLLLCAIICSSML